MKIKETKIIRITIITVIAIIVMIQTSIAATTGKITSDTVRVRKEPSTSAGIVALVSIGDEVDVLEKSGDWYKIRCTYEGEKVTGYVRGDLIKVKDEADLTSNDNPTTSEKPSDETGTPTDNPETDIPEPNTSDDPGNSNEDPIDNEQNNNQSDKALAVLSINESIQEQSIIALTKDVDIKILPLVNSTTIATITTGTEVTVVEIINQWARIEAGDLIGWVRIGQ